MLKKNIPFSLLLIFSGYLIYAQDVEVKSITEQLWLDYNPVYALSEQVELYGDWGKNRVPK